MNKDATIVITGAAGFIGSCLAGFLNHRGYENLLLVDDFHREDKEKNLADKKYKYKVEREEFFGWLEKNKPSIQFIFHLGARTDTTEFDYAVHQRLNVDYSIAIWKYAAKNSIPLVYASSAATYGDGNLGYNDDHGIIEDLKPLNPYGVSKNEFDKWVLKNEQTIFPPFWAGLKFFNVYGPNENHKGRMASVIFHAYRQIIENGFVKLFRSHKTEFKDGQQLRDFIYVKDLLKVCTWFMQEYDLKKIPNGLYNLGTGKARSFNDLVTATFQALNKSAQITYIDMPADLHGTYQYFTEANMGKLLSAGYSTPFYSLEEGVGDYVTNYLSTRKTY